MSWLRGRPEALVVVSALAAVTAGYQARPTVAIPASSLLSSLTYRDFYGEEAGVRWSRGRSAIVFPGVGPGRNWRLELEAAGWRPRGDKPPILQLEAAQGGLMVRPTPFDMTLPLDVTSSGAWSSDLVLTIESETWSPGAQDPRTLGVRVRNARLVPSGAGMAPPPLRPLLLVTLAALLAFGTLVRVGVSRPASAVAGASLGVAFGAAFALARPWAALAAGPAAIVAVACAALTYAAPATSHLLARWLAASGVALARGARAMGAAAIVGLALLAAVAATLAYRAAPSLDIDLGSGHEAGVAKGFGVFDSKDGATFRIGRRGSALDLSDAGAGTWRVSVTAALPSGPREIVLARSGSFEVARTVDTTWSTYRFDVPAASGFASGAVIELPGGARVDRVVVERGRCLPSPRVVAAMLLAGALLGTALASLGLPRAAAITVAALAIVATAAALAADPVASLPFVLPWLAVCAAGSVLAALVAGAFALDGGVREPWPVAAAAAVCGFVAWLAVTTFPLYAGGHFTFHSSIAEEIWKGRFLVYYLPFPGSMLSQQAQWGNIVVPHPCLEQTLMAPLAALPHGLFYVAEKIVLASWLAGMVLVAAALATRLSDARAGAWAAVATVTLVPTYQLLGLGHLMTILGILASSVAMTFVVLRLERLPERASFWTAVGLLTFCFLSYTAALLFTGLVLTAIAAGLWRGSRPLARALAITVVTAGVLAFALYYVNWAVPFLSQSVPRIFAGPSAARGTEAGVPLLSRLFLQPRKWNYSYGSLLVPLAAVAGLAWAPRSRSRLLVLAWAGILVAISGADLFFNFLLKHHYFLIVPAAAGLGVLLARLYARGSAGRIAAVVLLGGAALLGAETALAVATGRIP